MVRPAHQLLGPGSTQHDTGTGAQAQSEVHTCSSSSWVLQPCSCHRRTQQHHANRLMSGCARQHVDSTVASRRRRLAAASEQHKQRQQLGPIKTRLLSRRATADRHTMRLRSHLLDLCLDLIVVLGRLQEKCKSKVITHMVRTTLQGCPCRQLSPMPAGRNHAQLPGTAVLCCGLCRCCFFDRASWLQGELLLCDVASSRHSAAALTPAGAGCSCRTPHRPVLPRGHHCRQEHTRVAAALFWVTCQRGNGKEGAELCRTFLHMSRAFL